MTKDKMKMGYIEVETQQGCNLFPPHCKARGHVYHYSEILQEKVVGGFTNGRHKELEWETGYQATMQVCLSYYIMLSMTIGTMHGTELSLGVDPLLPDCLLSSRADCYQQHVPLAMLQHPYRCQTVQDVCLKKSCDTTTLQAKAWLGSKVNPVCCTVLQADTLMNASDCLLQVPGAEAVAEGYTWKNVLASYVHLHFGSAPELAQSLVDSCHGVDLNAVNAAAARACHQEQHAAAAAEQQSIIHGGHMNSLHGMQNGSLHSQPQLPKMMSVPDFAVPFQSSSLYRPSNLVRHSADDAEIPCAHSQLQQQQQFMQQVHQQHLPRKVRYDPDGRFVAVDVFAQAYNPADYQSLSPQRTSSLPIFYKPLKPHSLPTSPLNDVAEHSSMEAPPHPQGSYPPSQWGQQAQHQHSQLVYPQQQLHQQSHQQPLQQLGQQPQQLHSPFHSPVQGSSLHGSQSPTYPPPLEAPHSGAPPMNAILHPNGTLLPADAAMLTSHSLMSANSGLLSVNSGMLPEGAVYRPNSMTAPHPGVLSAHSSMLPNGAVSCNDRVSSLMHGDGILYRNDDTSTASTSGRMTHGSHGHDQTQSRSSSSGLPPATPGAVETVNADAIVSLLPSGTEILYALGLADRYCSGASLHCCALTAMPCMTCIQFI